MVRAIELERQLTKDQILNLYLALAPYRRQSRRHSRRLDRLFRQGAEAAVAGGIGAAGGVAAIAGNAPRSIVIPMRRAPRATACSTAWSRRASCPKTDAAQAKAVPVPRMRKPMPILAPHSADRALAIGQGRAGHHADAGFQPAEDARSAGARPRASRSGRIFPSAIIAVDNASGEVLARVGSPDYFDDRRAGQVDMTRAVRSPGSTLKPFIYGLAFEDGFVHPESLIDDRPIRFGSYAPENFDMTFQGTVPVRKALQLSLNVPAIALLDRVGASRLSSRLKQAGANLVLPKDEVPGLAMGLGGVGVTLQDLVQLYSGLARLGTTRPLREIMSAQDDERDPLRLMDQVAAWQVGNVLMGTPPPENARA